MSYHGYLAYQFNKQQPFVDVHQLRSRQMEGILVTPRDLTKSTEPPFTYGSQSFRYRGYPEENFEKTRHPVINDPTEPVKLYTDFTESKYKKVHQFDIGTSKAYGPDRKTFVYGSSNLPGTEIHPKPIAGALMDKSDHGTIKDLHRETTSAQLRRFNENKSLAEQEILGFKQARQREIEQIKSEQRQDMTMLQNYNPWGKPGGGAPLSDSPEGRKKRVFTEVDLERKNGFTPVPNAMSQELMEEHGDFHAGFGRPGAGAVLRTNSGNIRTELKSDADIRFQTTNQGKHIIDVEARYKPKDPSLPQQYAQNLETQIQERRLREIEERKRQLAQEINMMQHDPFGKPGAGAPNASKSAPVGDGRTPRGNYETDRKFQDERQSGREADDYSPWGKGYGNPDYNEFGDVRGNVRSEHYRGGVHTHITPRREVDEELGGRGLMDLDKTRGGGGAPVKGDNGRIVTRMPITMKRNEFGDSTIHESMATKPPRVDNDEERQVHFPFGKPGGGAPMRDHYGNVITTTTGNFNNYETYIKQYDPRKKFVSEDNGIESLHDIDRARKQRESHDYRLKHGGGEFATEMKKFQTGRPKVDPNTGYLAPNHLGTTDVTRERVNAKLPVHSRETQDYRTELQQEAEYRNRKRELEKRKEQQEARRHADSMQHFWGKPGGGAPKDENRKLNLDAIINSPRIKSGASRSHRDHFHDDFNSYRRPSISEPSGPGQKDYYTPRQVPQNNTSRSGGYNSYLKNTSGSSAYNGYEVEPLDRKQIYAQQQNQNWHQPPPFAAGHNYDDK